MHKATISAFGTVVALALAPAAFAATPGHSWTMDLNGGVVLDANGSESMTFTGQGIVSTTGRVGGAVEFTTAPSFGTVTNSKNDNPGAQNFAMGLVFTSLPIPPAPYSGNLMQKGLFDDPGQVKLQLDPANQGSVNCRIKGTLGAKIIRSAVNVDDGAWHTAVCWRVGKVVGVTVDDVVTSLSWNPGSISNTRTVLLGNKGIHADASDQHFGRTDFATWVIDANARAIAEQQVLTSG